MAQRIQDLKPLSRDLQDSDMFEMQGSDIGSARTTAGDIKNMAVEESTSISNKALSDHESTEAGNGVLGHVKLVNNALPPELIPNGYDASFQQFAGSFIQFSAEANLPDTVVPCYGGVLYPSQFRDQLVSLKSKIPSSWIQADGSVKLPNLMDTILSFSPVNGFGDTYNLSTLSGQRYAALQTTTADNVPVSTPKNIKSFSVVTCIVTGQINQINSNKTYYLHDPISGEYTGMQIQLPVVTGKDEGVGFNPDLMKDSIVQRKQSDIAIDYWSIDNMCGDPVGILSGANENPSQINTSFTLSKIPEIVRTFNMDGIPMVFDIKQGWLYIYRKDNPNQYIAFQGGFTYPGKNTWFNGGAALLLNSNVIRLSSTKIQSEYNSPSTSNALQFSGWINVNGIIAIRGGQVLMQLGVDYNNNDRVIVPFGMWTWLKFYQNSVGNEQQRNWIYDWLKNMPSSIMNKLERYPNIPMYKNGSYDWIIDANKDAGCVWYGEVPLKQIPYVQNNLLSEFFADPVSKVDNYNVQTNINAQNFDIDTVMAVNGRKIYVDGYIVTLDVKPNYFQWQTDEGYILRVNQSAVWDQNSLNYPQGNITKNGCNASFTLNMSTNSVIDLIFPDNSKQPIQTKTTTGVSMYFYIRESVTGVSAGTTPKKYIFDSMVTQAPTDRQDDATEFFTHFPLNWVSTQDQLKSWTSGGNSDFRWYMKNIGVSQFIKIKEGAEVSVRNSV